MRFLSVQLLCWIIIELFPVQIISIFGEQNELYMEFACMCLQIFMGALMTAGVSIVTGTFFQAIGKPAQATVLTLLCQIVIFVPTILILGASGDITKVLWTGPISDAGSCIASLIVLGFLSIQLKKKASIPQQVCFLTSPHAALTLLKPKSMFWKGIKSVQNITDI